MEAVGAMFAQEPLAVTANVLAATTAALTAACERKDTVATVDHLPRKSDEVAIRDAERMIGTMNNPEEIELDLNGDILTSSLERLMSQVHRNSARCKEGKRTAVHVDDVLKPSDSGGLTQLMKVSQELEGQTIGEELITILKGAGADGKEFIVIELQEVKEDGTINDEDSSLKETFLYEQDPAGREGGWVLKQYFKRKSIGITDSTGVRYTFIRTPKDKVVEEFRVSFKGNIRKYTYTTPTQTSRPIPIPSDPNDYRGVPSDLDIGNSVRQIEEILRTFPD